MASEARDRLLRVASDLFYREGINAVGVERILAEAGVTRATMYRHFTGKEQLVESYLALEDETIRGYFATGARQATSPQHLVELVITGIADDIERYHTRGCPFINAAAEFPSPDSTIRAIVRTHRDWFRSTLAEALTAAGHPDPDQGAAALVLLRDAALVGGYLDGSDVVKPAFIATARTAITS